jgi:hypothetical protein
VAYAGLGTAYLLLNDKDSAIKQYETLKNLNPELANIWFKGIYK